MWALASEEPADDTIHVTSDPQKVDTDGDRLDDPQEIRKTHTDPSAVQTYGITADHESDFRNAFQGQKSGFEKHRARRTSPTDGAAVRGHDSFRIHSGRFRFRGRQKNFVVV